MSQEQQIFAEDRPEPGHLARSRPGDESLGRALALVRFLRERCAWDARQTPASLRPYLLEEAHEVADAILAGSDAPLSRELGDLLLNVAFQIVLAEERQAFEAETVVRALEQKMEERHPHVYGEAAEPPDWETLKARQREERAAPGEPSRPDPFDGLPAGLEPLSRALRMQDRAAAWNFDWPEVGGAVEKLKEEIAELEALFAAPAAPGTEIAPGSAEGEAALEEELGDLLFATVNVCRLAGIHPTTALERAAAKFGERFRRLLELAAAEGIEPRRASLEELDKLWEAAKAEERSGS